MYIIQKDFSYWFGRLSIERKGLGSWCYSELLIFLNVSFNIFIILI